MSVAVEPAHTAESKAATTAVGVRTTATKTLAVSEQPLASVAVTVYPVLGADGTTVIEAVTAEVLHKYVLPPETVSVTEFPEQTLREGAAVMLGVGNAFTATLCVAVAEHPKRLVAVTVYEVGEAGFTTITFVVAVVLHT